MQSPPFSRYLVPSSLLGPNIILNTMFSNTLSFLSSRIIIIIIIIIIIYQLQNNGFYGLSLGSFSI